MAFKDCRRTNRPPVNVAAHLIKNSAGPADVTDRIQRHLNKRSLPKGLCAPEILRLSVVPTKRSFSLFFFVLTNNIQLKWRWWSWWWRPPVRLEESRRYRSPPPPASVASAAQQRAGTRISTTWHKHFPLCGLDFCYDYHRLSEAKVTWCLVTPFHSNLGFLVLFKFLDAPDTLNLQYPGGRCQKSRMKGWESCWSGVKWASGTAAETSELSRMSCSSRTWINSALTYFITLLNSTCDSAFSEFPHQRSVNSICQNHSLSTSNVRWPLL